MYRVREVAGLVNVSVATIHQTIRRLRRVHRRRGKVSASQGAWRIPGWWSKGTWRRRCPSGLHRLSDQKRPVNGAVLVLKVTDALSLSQHLVTLDAFHTGRSAGRYAAVCGATLLVASMTTEERGYCRACLRWRSGQCG